MSIHWTNTNYPYTFFFGIIMDECERYRLLEDNICSIQLSWFNAQAWRVAAERSTLICRIDQLEFHRGERVFRENQLSRKIISSTFRHKWIWWFTDRTHAFAKLLLDHEALILPIKKLLPLLFTVENFPWHWFGVRYELHFPPIKPERVMLYKRKKYTEKLYKIVWYFHYKIS